MTHRDAVVDGDSIKLSGIAAHFLYFLTDYLSYLVKMRVTRNKLGKRVDNSNDRFAELFVFHACGHPQGTGSSHSSAFSTYGAAQRMFHN